jgi:glucose-6-phosphate isomerase, archaeal
MMDLKKISGIGISLDDQMELQFSHEIKVGERSVRTLKGMSEYEEPLTSADETPIYKVFRYVMDMKDGEILNPTGLEYDLTVVMPGTFKLSSGISEYYRTAGHYHQLSKTGQALPEVYEVLSGRAQWLIQRYENDSANLSQVYLIEAGPGEKVLIPPHFGHITINAESSVLVISNIISKEAGHDYAPFAEFKGGGYRLLASREQNMIEIERNGSYQSVPPLSKLKPRKDWYNGYFEPLYSILVSHPDRFTFLTKPESYNPEFFSIKKLFQEIH